MDGLARRRPPWSSPPNYTAWALRHLRLRADCTAREVRLAFLREYVPVAQEAAKGSGSANRRCRQLQRFFRAAMRWTTHRRPPAPFVAAYGALHVWEWRVGLDDLGSEW